MMIDMAPRDPFDRLVNRCEWQGNCLVWTGTTVRGRYGHFRPTTNQTDPKVYVHRWIYETTVGPIPDGAEIDHVRDRGCKSTLCVNPDHLEPVTPIENKRRTRLDLCKAGKHMLTDLDAQWDQQGRRRGCVECKRESARQWYWDHREQVLKRMKEMSRS